MKLRKTKAVSPLEEFVAGRINKTSLVLWYYLRNKANEDGVVEGISTQVILKETHTCPRSFYAAVNTLKKMGVLEVVNTIRTDVCDTDGVPFYAPVPKGYDFSGERRGPNTYKLIGG